MGWVTVIVTTLFAILKGIWGMDSVKKETTNETKQDADLDTALADPNHLPDADKLRSDFGANQRK